MSDTSTLPTRSEVPLEQTWDLASIYPTPKDWEAACNQLIGMLPDLSVYRGHLGENPRTLLQFIQAYQEVGTLMGKIGVYANNAYAVNTLDQDAAARSSQARSLMSKFAAATAFFNPELMQIGFPNGSKKIFGWDFSPITWTGWKSAKHTCALVRSKRC